MEDLLYYNLVDVIDYIKKISLGTSVNLSVVTFKDSNSANEYLINNTQNLANNCYMKTVKDTFRGLPRHYVYYVSTDSNITYITVVVWGSSTEDYSLYKTISDNLMLLDIDALPTVDNNLACIEPDLSLEITKDSEVTISKTYLEVMNANNKMQLILVFTINDTVIATFICKEQSIHGMPYRIYLPLYKISDNAKDFLKSLKEVM